MVKELGFSGEYVEKMSPAERKLYWSYFEEYVEEMKKKEQKEGQVTNNPYLSIGTVPNAG